MATTVPNVLVDGTVPRGADFNENFDALAAAIDVLAGPTTPGATITTGIHTIRGLVGTVTTTTIAIAADSVAFRTAARTVAAADGVTGITINSAIAGLNGRDQVAAFSASQTLYAYLITNGSAVAGVLADSAPPTGPDLATVGSLSEYTAWAYVAPLIWTGASLFIPSRLRGSRVFYEARQVAATGQEALTETAISVVGSVPAGATSFGTRILAESDSNTNTHHLRLRVVSTKDYFVFDNTGAGFGGWRLLTEVEFPNVSQQVLYLWDLAPGGQRDLELDVLWYRCANGDA